tara:strand:+ start:418 stop:615 length:198 start_codon:yes stop_codon:yes gene_type:complete
MDHTDENTPIITLPDLQEIYEIIKLASDRGAFRIGEYSQVGACFDKLQKFLTQAHFITNQGEQNV